MYVKRPYKSGHIELNCFDLTSDKVHPRTYSFFAHRSPVSRNDEFLEQFNNCQMP